MQTKTTVRIDSIEENLILILIIETSCRSVFYEESRRQCKTYFCDLRLNGDVAAPKPLEQVDLTRLNPPGHFLGSVCPAYLDRWALQGDAGNLPRGFCGCLV